MAFNGFALNLIVPSIKLRQCFLLDFGTAALRGDGDALKGHVPALGSIDFERFTEL